MVYESRATESSCGLLSLEMQLRPRPATLVGGPLLIGRRARAKLVPRVLRMRQVPGAKHRLLHRDERPFPARADALRVSCASAWHLLGNVQASASDAQSSVYEALVIAHRDERVKDERRCQGWNGSGSLD